jgi:hypothetical protein
LVGRGNWHGIPEMMMEAETSHPSNGFIAIGITEKSRIRCFIGSLKPVLAQRQRLPRNQRGDYQFTYHTNGKMLVLDQVPGMFLDEIV